MQNRAQHESSSVDVDMIKVNQSIKEQPSKMRATLMDQCAAILTNGALLSPSEIPSPGAFDPIHSTLSTLIPPEAHPPNIPTHPFPSPILFPYQNEKTKTFLLTQVLFTLHKLLSFSPVYYCPPTALAPILGRQSSPFHHQLCPAQSFCLCPSFSSS